MRKGALAGAGLVFIGMGVAAPAMADPWEVCVIGACLQNSCSPPEGTVMVTTPIDLADPAVGDSYSVKSQLAGKLLERGTPSQSQDNCVGPFPTEAAAAEKSIAIYQNMRNSFSDVSMYRGNELFPTYGQGSSVASTSNDSSDDSSNASSTDSASNDDSDERAAQAQAEAAAREREAAQAQADNDRRAQEAAAAEQARIEREAQIAAQREQDRIAQETRRAEQQAAAEELRKKMDERASTDTDANQCVSSPTLRQNASFQGNTAASVVNGCGTPVDVRICLMTESNGWNCGVNWGLAPQSSWSHSTFHATGQVFVDARVSGSSRAFNSP